MKKFLVPVIVLVALVLFSAYAFAVDNEVRFELFNSYEDGKLPPTLPF